MLSSAVAGRAAPEDVGPCPNVADGVELTGGRGGAGVEALIGEGLSGKLQESRLKRRISKKERALRFIVQGVRLRAFCWFALNLGANSTE